ncbi:hypothetical protein AB4072_04990 [Microvirga sp. 2MCAF38]|uniref:hypothetical protein n=1 Tax=Microvirga sp. 2MCAF38 TaxID=3232989 RepID=UPI003F950798
MSASFPSSYFISLSAVLSLLLFSAGSGSAAPIACPGPSEQPHPMYPFDFGTNSRVEGVTAGQYKSAIVSCISNKNPDDWLYVHWLIPRVQGWVVPGGMIDSGPRLQITDAPVPMDTCLKYGNRSDTVSALYLGNDLDLEEAALEKRNGCRATVAGTKPSVVERIQEIIQQIKVFFPSDAKRPKETMLELSGEATVVDVSENTFTSRLTYSVSRVGNSNGSVEGVRMRPAFNAGASSLTEAFGKKYPEPIKLREKDAIAFTAQAAQPRLIYTSLEVLDINGVSVASITFPVYVTPNVPK